MRVLFAGTPCEALLRGLRALGHEALNPPDLDWWALMKRGAPPSAWGDALASHLTTGGPWDAFVLHKGYHFWQGAGGHWRVPLEALAYARSKVQRMAYMCFDDPACTPITLQLQLAVPFDLWLTSCPGIASMFALPPRPRVEEFWLAWDELLQVPEREERYAVDVAICGHPYYQPFPTPHHQAGFGNRRADIARAVLARGWTLGIWGPDTWLSREHGGDPQLAPHYRGWLDVTMMPAVQRSASVNLATQLCEGPRYESGRMTICGGASICVLHEDRPGLREEFGSSVAWYETGNLESCMQAVERLLEQPLDRARMAGELRAIVLERHTWAARARKLAELLAP